ncbi:MAG: hypothetical protein CMD65_00915 [Gammaproteobacteria bacterium]|nr:hypothetical protein [Gammaproteobacteria bacterium]
MTIISNENILLAGYGYLGQYIIEEINNTKKNYNITTLSRSNKISAANINHITSNFDENTRIEFDNNSRVIYMAPPSNATLEDTRLQNFLSNIVSSEIKSLLYISTSGIYGNHNGLSVNENTKPTPNTNRAKRRLDAEEKIKVFAEEKNISYVILRVPGIYGPDRLPIDKIKKNIPLIKIDESPLTNLINVKDLARLVIATQTNNLENEIINVSDGKPIKVTNYYLKICNVMNFAIPNFISINEAKKIFDEKRLSFLLESRSLDVTKMKKLLPGCIKFENLETGIKDSLK